MKLILAAAAMAALMLPMAAQTAPSALSEGAVAAAPAPQVAANASAHTALTGDVMEALTSTPGLGGVSITVNVVDTGVVSLNGVVGTQAELDRALAVVKAVPGVKSVTSNMLVNQDPFSTPSVAAASAAGGAGVDQVAEEASNPQTLVAKALAADAGLSGVAATIYGNKVIVYGMVSSSQAHDRALQIVRQMLPKYEISDIVLTQTRSAGPALLLPKS